MGAFSCQLCQFPGVHNVPNCHGRPAVQCGRNAWLGDGNCLLLHDLKIHRPGRAMERRDENLSQLKWMAFVIQHDLATYFLKGLCYSHSKSVGCLLGFSTATAGWFGFPILSSNELLLDMSYLPSWKNIIAAWNHVNHVYKHTYIYMCACGCTVTRGISWSLEVAPEAVFHMEAFQKLQSLTPKESYFLTWFHYHQTCLPIRLRTEKMDLQLPVRTGICGFQTYQQIVVW